MSDPIVGIDLGTSNTVVAHATSSGAVTVLADSGGYKIHPSVVSFHPTGGVVIGAGAKQRKVIDPKNTIFSVKRLIGRSYKSPEVQTAKQRMPYQIKEGANQLPVIVTRGGEFAVPEISAIVLDFAKNIATGALGTPISRAVVTVPASFNDAQRSATATAGSIAGLTVARVLNEPTAAALAYGNTRDLRETIAVYDFGGGTFDITILKLADQVYEVLGTAGNSFLGGDDIDERLVDRMVEKFLSENRVDLRTNEVSMMRLRAVAEQVKIELSRRSRAMVRIDEIAYGAKGKPLDLHIEIRRDELVQQVADIIDRTFPVCEEALELAGLTIDHINDVILVGGTTKIPYVRDQVAKFFAKAPRTDVNPEEAVAVGAALQANALERSLGTDHGTAPSRGARPVTRGEHTDVFEERTPPPVAPNTPVIGRMSKPNVKPPPKTMMGIPVVKPPSPPPPPSPASTMRGVAPAPVHEEEETTGGFTDVETQKSIKDFELDDIGFPNLETEQEATSPAATAKGFSPPASAPPISTPAAKTIVVPPSPPPVPASTPAARTIVVEPAPPSTPTIVAPQAPAYPAPKPPVVMDVTPRGLGIGTVAGFCEELIRRNSRVPAEIRKLFTTSRDDQESVRIIVCQGESRRLDNNTVIGDLVLSNLPARPRGETSIEVTFALDASGILQVRARDAQTGREQRATLDVVGNVAQEDVGAAREKLQHALRR